jgi:anthranilate phosphoribosyltransferase
MSISKYIKEIGRGKDGARALNAEQAQDLMTQVLEGRVTDLEVGAFALAMRIKGETPAELAGFLAAARGFCLAPASASPTPAVWLPSYNGARKLPNLTALLALLLAREGVPVLVHGPAAEPGRVATAEVIEALGLTLARDEADIAAAWRLGLPAFITTELLCPPLERLLAVRRVVGLRNSGHTVAKVLLPAVVADAGTGTGTGGIALVSPSSLPAAGTGASASSNTSVFRVVNHTHPEYAELLTQFLSETGADAMLLRGTEGEPVADARRTPRMDVFLRGMRQDAFSVPAREGVLTQLPDVPRSCDLASTSAYIEAVLQGRLPTPEPIAAQVAAIAAAAASMAAAQAHSLSPEKQAHESIA